MWGGVDGRDVASVSHALRWLVTRAVHTGCFGTAPALLLMFFSLLVALAISCLRRSRAHNKAARKENREQQGFLKSGIMLAALAVLFAGLAARINERGAGRQVLSLFNASRTVFCSKTPLSPGGHPVSFSG